LVPEEHISKNLLQQIIFQNDVLIALDKPAGWLSVPSRLGLNDTRPCVGTLLQQTLKRRIWPVHRLDFEVSGILIFALHEKAHSALCSIFERRLVTKTYEAWSMTKDPSNIASSMGKTPPFFVPELNKIYMWNSCLVRGKKRTFEASHGQNALTRSVWEGTATLKSSQSPSIELSRWKLNPHTGRPHQLRYEMFKHGIPIIGDTLYSGAPLLKKKEMIALKCTKLEFTQEACNKSLAIPAIIQTQNRFIDQIQDEII
jgi:23S rRNA-/tRNA-specific pseudouridylate synthase